MQPIDVNSVILIHKTGLCPTMLCEGCGVEVASKPWPEGWVGTGRSLRRIRSFGTGVMGASWCPLCQRSGAYFSRKNPSEIEIHRLRQAVLGVTSPRVWWHAWCSTDGKLDWEKAMKAVPKESDETAHDESRGVEGQN